MQTLLKQETKNTIPTVLGKLTYSEAKAIISGKVKSHKDYQDFITKNPKFNLPLNPRYTFKDQWVSASDFFGVPECKQGAYLKQYWADVKAGIRVRPTRYKSRSITQTASSKSASKVKYNTPPTLKDKQTFIELAKKLGVYEEFKPAFKSLFTYDELLDISFR